MGRQAYSLVVRYDRKTLKEVSRHLENPRPMDMTMEEYLTPAAEFITSLREVAAKHGVVTQRAHMEVEQTQV